MPDENALKAYYDSESYFQGNDKGSYTNYDLDTEGVLPLFSNLLSTIPNATGKKILDIGCAFGTHLAIAAEQGWEAWGIELSDYARKTALSRHGEKIHVVETIDSLPKLEFDLIVILDVVEHLPNPYQLFIELLLHGAIGKKTKIVITTPNARSADALADPSGWAYRHPPAHLVYFSANSLRLLLTNLGGIKIAVQGIHPVEHQEVYNYLDETNTLNHNFQDYAGLMAVVQGVDTFLYKLLAVFKVESISIKNSEIAALYREVCAIQKEVMKKHALEEQHLNEVIEKKEAELGKKEEEILSVYQSKWHKLGIALKMRPMTLQNFIQIASLSVGLMIPDTFRAKVVPIISKFYSQHRMQGK
jgi:2-polyprenyl-3-methyl-5-hydroxy-6-metoxy-1,4-benzoquinol methylase